MQGIMETIFDVLYLGTVITVGIVMIRRHTSGMYRLFGIMAVVLGCGDAFHLIPRSYALLNDGLLAHTAALGIGKLITSVTMTLFYVILYLIWRKRYKIVGRKNLDLCIYSLAIVRVALCFFPQNGWLSAHPSLAFGIARNIPFAILGLLIIVLYAQEIRRTKDRDFRFLPVAVTLSFGFYIPVVLWADTFPAVGILMIPKTMAYVWIVLIGYLAGKKEDVLHEKTY